MTRNATSDDWYVEKRRHIEAFFEDSNLLPDSDKVHFSPSGKYRLVVRKYKTKEGRWLYSRGLVFSGDHQIADLKRNFTTFFFGWAENHPNGHDYVLCGEDYQGQTVIELDTDRRVDFIVEAAQPGHAFCCAGYYPSQDRKLIVIDGCYWACPYELVFCRFDDPMALPWPQLDRAELSGEPQGWTDEGFIYESTEEIRTTDMKGYDELSDAEQDELCKRWKEIGGNRIRRLLRKSDGSKVMLDQRIVPNASPTMESADSGKGTRQE